LDKDDSDKDFAPVNKINTEIMNDEEILKQIDDIVKGNRIVLFMKGSPEMPNCGYSKFVSQVLKFYKIDEYKTVDILRDQDIRRLVKTYSDWPTIPQ